MKFIAPLDEQTQAQLRRLIHDSPNARVRQRAHAILLSSKRYRIDEIADIFEVDRDTVSRWLDNWNQRGTEPLATEPLGNVLADEPRSGRPRTLTDDEQQQACAIVLEEPRQIKLGLARIEQTFGIKRSLDWLRDLLHAERLRYKRIRASLRSKRDETAFRAAREALAVLERREAAGEIDLYYLDEAGFALRPALSYAWQPVGERLEVLHTGRAQINVLGLLRCSGALLPWICEGAITSETVIACLDHLAAGLVRPSVVVLDNATMHRSAAFKACLARWQQQGLQVQYLPSYSPELNRIEHLWRKIKYLWLPLRAYVDFKSLVEALEEILVGVGTKYRITFS